jgi:hypothetical protein
MKAITERRLCIVHDPALVELKAVTAAVDSQRKLLRNLATEEAKLLEITGATKRAESFRIGIEQENKRLKWAADAARADLAKLEAQIEKAHPVAQAAAILDSAVAMFNTDPIPCEAVMAGIELARAIRLQAKWRDEEPSKQPRRRTRNDEDFDDLA